MVAVRLQRSAFVLFSSPQTVVTPHNIYCGKGLLKMPVFTLETNVEVKPDLQKALSEKLTQIVSQVLSKPSSYVAVKISSGLAMTFGGTDAPCALCSLTSLGQINKENNTEVSSQLASLLKDSLGVEGNRYYVTFVDLDRSNVGYNGSVF
mmetsp:Transcript_11343/g.14774  ORF Transcript_11343/g.14774 Transcript_11343/m.14774 type:complete len:150 (+) Transcript_11343:76-525(+)